MISRHDALVATSPDGLWRHGTVWMRGTSPGMEVTDELAVEAVARRFLTTILSPGDAAGRSARIEEGECSRVAAAACQPQPQHLPPGQVADTGLGVLWVLWIWRF